MSLMSRPIARRRGWKTRASFTRRVVSDNSCLSFISPFLHLLLDKTGSRRFHGRRGVEGVAAVTSKRSASPEDDAAAASKKPKRSASDEEAGAQTSEQTKLVDGAAASSSASGRDKFFLDSLPCASRYIRSLMHRDTLTFVKVTPHTNFVLTASLDGFVKFWKKQETGVEFVKQYRAHLAPVTGLCAILRMERMYADASGRPHQHDQGQLHAENLLLGASKREADSILAVSEEGSPTIRLYDGRGDGSPRATIESLHRAPCHLLAVGVRDQVQLRDIGQLIVSNTV
ncbi:hypothetical protein L7F22_029854 [Adiantum nelumboides]|nr:hypothetical protein [Adiantum nelumboides]